MNMAGAISCHSRLPLKLSPSQSVNIKRFRAGFLCCSDNKDTKDTMTSQLLKIVVGGATEILRLLSSFNKNELYKVVHEVKDEPSASSLDDIITMLESDYENAYFVTGNFNLGIYAEDCLFEDPTIKFRVKCGLCDWRELLSFLHICKCKELYLRNLKLLVPFFDQPSISLKSIKKVMGSPTEFVMASWRLRTYLKLPWRPLISIDGTTVYDLNDQFKIVKHVENWSVSPLEAIGQIFTPSSPDTDE